MKQVAGYVRVSTMEQAESGYSIDEQVEKLTAYCKARDWNLTKVYKDPGFSGSNINRPGMEKLVSDAKSGYFDTVLVYKLDRLSRSQKDTLYLIEDIFNKYNVAFVSLSENFDTSTAFGKAMIGILSVFAQLEREQIRERMTMGKVGRAKSGKAMNWSNTPFGYTYRNDQMFVDEFQGSIVKRIYSDYLNGVSITKIRDHLNEEGHLGKDINWSYRTVRGVLDNETYTGITKYRGQTFPGTHQALISSEIYEQTQAELKRRQITAAEMSNNPRPFRAKFMLSGLLRCGYCTASFSVLKSHTKHGPHRYYKCNSRFSKKAFTLRQYGFCPSCNHDMKELEEYILSEIHKLQLSPGLIVPSNRNSDVGPLKDELKKIESQQAKLIDLYLDSHDLPLERLNERRDKLAEQHTAITAKLNNMAKPDVEPAEAQQLLSKSDDIFSLEYDQQKTLVKQLIKQITVYNNKLDIQWSFDI
ncbi:recombinase family protein [Ligilactobacillus salitolerans]|uniref:recombinase family protein n=1 Tax=Ligilactobacillus salitolerans TaxID=1808352 RepID=UPI003F75D663